MGRIGMQPSKNKQLKIRSLDGSGALWNNFSKEEPKERPTLGILFIK